MKDRGYLWLLVFSIVLILILTSVPYYLAARRGGEDYVFAGFLMNPLDGNTYLAKMYQGYQGNWKYTLPYTAVKGEGAYLFEFYLFLGHLARLFDLPLIIVFHLARLLCTVIMLISIFRFIKLSVPDAQARSPAFILAAFGSGLGWVALIAGRVTSDFWVAEAYPFLSAYTNPHFPLGIALTLMLITPIANWRKDVLLREAMTPFLTLALAIVYPFGVVLVLILVGMMAFWEKYLITQRALPQVYHWRLIISAVFGLPMLMYYLWVIYSDPIFSAWNAQNLTPSPGIVDFIISFSPLIILALPTVFVLSKQKLENNRVVVFWLVVGIALLYLPWSLQRRFIYGLYIPIAVVAVMGIYRLVSDRNSLRWVGTVFIVLSLPTNIVVLFSAGPGIFSRNTTIFVRQDEEQAFQWLSKNTPEDAVIIAAPETGLFIPARAGRRVIYGHPFETIDADKKRESLIRFFQGIPTTGGITPLLQGDYLIYGPREKELGDGDLPAGLEPVYENGSTRIYQVIQ